MKRKNSKFVQGVYTPINPDRTTRSRKVFRSSLELKAFRFLDNNPKVKFWDSERIILPYQGMDGKLHRYFTDLVVHLEQNDGTIKKLVIEIKPESQTKPPIVSIRKSQKTVMYEQYQYALNTAKWLAATAWCSKKGYQFVILTEKHLN